MLVCILRRIHVLLIEEEAQCIGMLLLLLFRLVGPRKCVLRIDALDSCQLLCDFGQVTLTELSQGLQRMSSSRLNDRHIIAAPWWLY